jgi:hypothetical protein
MVMDFLSGPRNIVGTSAEQKQYYLIQPITNFNARGRHDRESKFLSYLRAA